MKKIKSYIKEKREKRNLDKKKRAERVLEVADRLYDLKQYNEAIKDYLKYRKILGSLITKDEKNVILLRIAKSHYYSKDLKNAKRFADKAGKDEDSLFLKGLICLGYCNFNRDWKEFKKLCKNKYGFLKGTKEYIKKKRKHDTNLRKAFGMFKELAKEHKRNPEYWYFFGVCCYFSKYVKEAIASFDIMLELNPEYSNDYIKIELIDEMKKERTGMQKEYKTARGVFVRSKAEAIIDNFYFHDNIKAKYEPTLVLGDKVLHPDWELEIEGRKLYHEHLGSAQSARLFEFKKKLYDKYKIPVMTTNADDENSIEDAIKRKLKAFTKSI